MIVQRTTTAYRPITAHSLTAWSSAEGGTEAAACGEGAEGGAVRAEAGWFSEDRGSGSGTGMGERCAEVGTDCLYTAEKCLKIDK